MSSRKDNSVQQDSLVANLDHHLNSINSHIERLDKRFDEIDRRAELRHQEVTAALNDLIKLYRDRLDVFETPQIHIQ